MTKLKIYNLDDEAEEQAICTLDEGEHEIGRGDTLKCKDKRVSRKHALINVDNKGASITSVHVNPCFYRPRGGHVKMLKLNMSSPLNDDDQFALIADKFWYKVKLLREPPNEPNNNGEEASEPGGSAKRKVEDGSTPDSKRQKNDVSLDLTVDEDDEQLEGSYFTNVTLPIMARLHQDEPTNNAEEASDPGNSAKEKVEDGSTPNSKRQKNDVSLDLTVDEDDEQLEGSYFTNATLPVTTRLLQDETMEEVVAAKDDEVDATKEDEVVAAKDDEVAAKDDEVDAVKDGEVDAAGDNGGAAGVAVTDNPEVGAGTGDPDPKVKAEPTNNANPNDTNRARVARRDRCWYGATCYRRNPIHRRDLSHPGDNDYASDPEEDRSLCPFGAGCYNRNADHRRQYKHIGPPAPKPTTSAPATKADDSDDNSTPPPPRTKKRKVAQKKKKYTETPEDDYDLDDPFLNDGSSDDFEVTDDDDDDDDDWEDSQEPEEEDSEETKRLMKEAKRFTRKGKK